MTHCSIIRKSFTSEISNIELLNRRSFWVTNRKQLNNETSRGDGVMMLWTNISIWLWVGGRETAAVSGGWRYRAARSPPGCRQSPSHLRCRYHTISLSRYRDYPPIRPSDSPHSQLTTDIPPPPAHTSLHSQLTGLHIYNSNSFFHFL